MRNVKTSKLIKLVLSALLVSQMLSAGATQTIVLLRHGEKPPAGLGQLDCRGLNRALALPDVLARFGRPAAIFAPNPGQMNEDGGVRYNYVRPLATIEPTAIRLGLPVDTRLGYDETPALQTALLAPVYRDAVVFVAWEHRKAEVLARALLSSLDADAAVVPRWQSEDFDSLYVIRIDALADGKRKAVFTHENEGLDGQSARCPVPAHEAATP